MFGIEVVLIDDCFAVATRKLVFIDSLHWMLPERGRLCCLCSVRLPTLFTLFVFLAQELFLLFAHKVEYVRIKPVYM